MITTLEGEMVNIKNLPKQELMKILCFMRYGVKGAVELAKLSPEKGMEQIKNIHEMVGNTSILGYSQEELRKIYDQEMEIAQAVVMFVDSLAEAGISVPELE